MLIEALLVLSVGVSSQHVKHLNSGSVDDGDARQESRSQVKWQDWVLRCRETLAFRGKRLVELGND